MSVDCLILPPEIPEWRRSGHFLLLALLLHAGVLFFPLTLAIGRVEMPPPGPVTVKLIEAAPLPLSQPDAPPQVAAPPTPSKKKPLPKPRPVLATAPQAAAPAAFSVPVAAPAPPAPAPMAAATPAVNAAPAAISAARFDAAYLHNPRPNYPPVSRRLGEEGKVLLKVKVSCEGLALAVDVSQSSDFERLDESARQTVARWRFVPAKRGEQAIESSVLVPIVFRLDA